ncbi:hypothetical protein HPB48_016849 [Haemaphysalis longicornis]|uniref:Uncharacterized protein n=1 Tax=Haemaphysalis longicornis TaxID=44386 RepID=A0A9J6FRK7_HAELO|nr:hypothetical protein HPB48_016849 [Haemaphysalis longicornis]
MNRRKAPRSLRTEWLRQARLYRDCLFVRVSQCEKAATAKVKWREYCRLINWTTESQWQTTLGFLRSAQPDKTPRSGNQVHVIGDAALPDHARRVLQLGPKYAMEPKKSAAEQLGMVRDVSRLASEDEGDMCVSQGVDVLAHSECSKDSVSLGKVSTSLVQLGLCVLPADKEGGFAVLPNDVFKRKASEAVDVLFARNDKVTLRMVKRRAKNLCEQLNLTSLTHSISNSKKCSLDLLFAAKTHKVGTPLRVIVSETGAWQNSVALFYRRGSTN